MSDKLKKEYNRIMLKQRHLCAYIDINKYATESECLNNTASILFGGADIIKLSSNFSSDEIFLSTAKKINQLCAEYNATFIIESRCDITYLAESDGVCLKSNDLSITSARELLGSNAIIGKETNTIDDSLLAIKNGADYISFGPIFPTPEKPAIEKAGIEYAKLINKVVDTPIFTWGNIDLNNVQMLRSFGTERVTIGNAFTNTISPNTVAESFSKILTS